MLLPATIYAVEEKQVWLNEKDHTTSEYRNVFVSITDNDGTQNRLKCHLVGKRLKEFEDSGLTTNSQVNVDVRLGINARGFNEVGFWGILPISQ